MAGLRDGLGPGTGVAEAREEFRDSVIMQGNSRLYFRNTGISIFSPEKGVVVMASDGTGESIRFDLSGKSVSNYVSVRDSDTFPVIRFDSAGNVQSKGAPRRLTTG